MRLVRRPSLLIFALATAMAGSSTAVLAQPSLNFPQAVASDLGDPNNGNAGAVSAGIAATAYNGTLWSAFVLDSNDVSCPGHLALQGVYNNSSTPHTPSMYYARVCTYLDRPNGQPQMTAFNGNIWVAYASADYYNYLFVASWNATSGWAVSNEHLLQRGKLDDYTKTIG